MAEARFAMGCFWKPELLFRAVRGVTDVTVGYSGGHVDKPRYRKVCGGQTGHAETLAIDFAPDIVSYDALLDVFWSNHTPPTGDPAHTDSQSQYRSAIFYLDEAQRQAAEQSRARLSQSGRFDAPVITQISASGKFYPAEEYHQRYLEKQGVTG